MKTDIDGTPYRLAFHHIQEYEKVGTYEKKSKYGDFTLTLDRLRPKIQPMIALPLAGGDVKARRGRAITECRIIKGGHGKDDPGVALSVGAVICSASEPHGFEKEFGRQAALARALYDAVYTTHSLTTDKARRLFGVYMQSGPRVLRDLSGVILAHELNGQILRFVLTLRHLVNGEIGVVPYERRPVGATVTGAAADRERTRKDERAEA